MIHFTSFGNLKVWHAKWILGRLESLSMLLYVEILCHKLIFLATKSDCSRITYWLHYDLQSYCCTCVISIFQFFATVCNLVYSTNMLSCSLSFVAVCYHVQFDMFSQLHSQLTGDSRTQQNFLASRCPKQPSFFSEFLSHLIHAAVLNTGVTCQLYSPRQRSARTPRSPRAGTPSDPISSQSWATPHPRDQGVSDVQHPPPSPYERRLIYRPDRYILPWTWHHQRPDWT
jgi:hypothetical protein